MGSTAETSKLSGQFEPGWSQCGGTQVHLYMHTHTHTHILLSGNKIKTPVEKPSAHVNTQTHGHTHADIQTPE